MARLDLPFIKVLEAGVWEGELVVNISFDAAAFTEALRRAVVAAGDSFASAASQISAFLTGTQGETLLRHVRKFGKRYRRQKRMAAGAGGSSRDRRRRRRAYARIVAFDTLMKTDRMMESD